MSGKSAAPKASKALAPRSAVLDTVMALQRGAFRLIICAILGGVLFYVLGERQPALFESRAVLVTQPDLLGISAAEAIKMPGADPVDPIIAVQLVEQVLFSRDAIIGAMRELEKLGYDNREQLGVAPEPGAGADAQEARLLKRVRQKVLAVDYGPRKPTLDLSVSVPESGRYARDLASALITQTSTRLSEIRLQNRIAGGDDIRAALERARAELAEAEARQLEFLQSRRLANDPASGQRKRELAREVETLQQSHRQLADLENLFTYASESTPPAVIALDGPNFPLVATTRFPILICIALGVVFGFFLGLLWVAYDAHLRAMRELNPELYG